MVINTSDTADGRREVYSFTWPMKRLKKAMHQWKNGGL
ncbi:Uncharacterised protein [Segatella copri]|nr:Uncharacterised protein [Segatella copri]